MKIFHAITLIAAFILCAPPSSAQEVVYQRLDLRDITVVDALRLMSEFSEENMVASLEAGRATVNLTLKKATVEVAIRALCRAAGLLNRLDEAANTYFIMTVDEFQENNVVFLEEQFRIFTLKHPRPDTIAEAVASLFGNRASVTFSQDGVDATDVGNRDQVGGQGRNRRGGNQGGGIGNRGGGGGFNQRQNELARGGLTPEQEEALIERLGENYDAEATRELLDSLTTPEDTRNQQRSPIFLTVLLEQNVIAVRTSDGRAMKQITEIIDSLDRPVAQVLLEMKILEAELGDDFRSVFDFDLVSGDTQTGPATFQPRNPLNPTAALGASNILGLGNFALEPNTLVYQFLSDDIRARLQLLKSDNRLDAIATPMLLATNNRLSRLELGGERLFVTGVDVVTNTTTNQGVTLATSNFIPVQELRDVGDRLELVPKIADDDTVTIDLVLETSSIRVGGSNLILDEIGNTIAIDTRDRRLIRMTMVAKDGFTIALGGLIRTEVSDSTSKIPILGDIPLIGALFRRDVKLRSKRELVILITPRIVGSGLEAQNTSYERGQSLSENPWLREGDKALQKYFRPEEEPEGSSDNDQKESSDR